MHTHTHRPNKIKGISPVQQPTQWVCLRPSVTASCQLNWSSASLIEHGVQTHRHTQTHMQAISTENTLLGLHTIIDIDVESRNYSTMLTSS